MRPVFRLLVSVSLFLHVLSPVWCQVKMATATVHTSQFQALNGTTKQQSNNRAMAMSTASSVVTIHPDYATGCHGADCKNVILTYEVPGFVMLDRLLLAGTIHNKIGGLLDQQQLWQNMTNTSNDTKQQMEKLLQGQIDQLQSISDNLTYNCPPVDFQGYAATVNADVRYNDPVSGIMGLMMANGSGDVNVSNLFNGIPINSLDASPVVGKMIIYTKR